MDSSLPAYAELHCLSNFTFLRGASHPEELVERAHYLHYSALAITDECSLAGVVRAHAAAKACGLPLIIGSEISLEEGLKLVLLATNREAYGNLSALITKGRRKAAKGHYALSRADLEHGLPNCLALLIPGTRPREADAHWLAERFPQRSWIAVELVCGSNDRARLEELRSLGKRARLPLVAAGDVHMHLRSRRKLQDVLTAIRLTRPVSECGPALYPNAERHLRSRMRLANLYPSELLTETLKIAERCNFTLESLRYEYPEELVPAGEAPASYLRRLTFEGLSKRFPQGVPQHVLELILHELALISELQYEPYFLTVYDIVHFAKGRGILCQGRGSAANSAVCYALEITEVDPARLNMLFERFISRERDEPPDIDIDFEHQRREEVIQYLYSKYGRERAALAATVITYRTKSALRDVGKALGLDLAKIDSLAKSIAWHEDRVKLAERLQGAGLDPQSPVAHRLIELAGTLMGFPRHLSQHTGGLVISRGPLLRMVPIENAAMPERTVIEWDKDDLDALGLLKVDVLGLGMLSAIRRALDLVSRFRGNALSMADVPPEDPAVYAMIGKADTIGVFQIESRAQMAMLPRLKPRNFYDLVIEVAIVRPGPIQGGMVHPYLKRRQGLEPVSYPSVAVKAVLERTLGVPIFQEQVMQLAIVAAGFTPGEADRLRRSMAAWRRKGGLEKYEKHLVEGMLKRGYSQEFAERIYKQILGFGEYGFPESHSASFALLVYISAWLKCYEPAAFLAALLNSQPMGFYAPSQLVQDARRHGVEVRPVDVLHSGWECTLETAGNGEPVVRLGFVMVKGLSETGAGRIVAARKNHGFASIDELARRAELNCHDLACLARAGTLYPLSGHRRLAFWEVSALDSPPPLLEDAPIQEERPLLYPPTEGQNLIADYASLGLTLGRHPLSLLRKKLKRMQCMTAEDIRNLSHGNEARAAGIVTCRQRPDTASGVVFVTLEDETGYINVVIWKDLGEQQRRALLDSRLLGVHGKIEREGSVVHLVARRLLDYSNLLGSLSTESRDFH